MISENPNLCAAVGVRLRRRYLSWQTDKTADYLFTKHEALPPVFTLSKVRLSDGTDAAEVNYYTDLNLKTQVGCDRFDLAARTEDDIYEAVVSRVEAEMWLTEPEYYSGKSLFTVHSPAGSFKLVDRTRGELRRSFDVTAEEHLPPCRGLHTRTCLEISVPAEQLTAGHTYDFCFAAGGHILEAKSGACSHVLTGISGEWAFAVSVYDPCAGPAHPYGVTDLESGTGFRIVLLDDSLRHLRFRLAWVNRNGASPDDCVDALIRCIG